MSKEQRFIVYEPSESGLPYLVATVANGEVSAVAQAESREAARMLIANMRFKSDTVVQFPINDCAP